MKYKRIGATGKGLTKSVLNAGGGRAEKFMGDAIRVGNRALPAGGSKAASTVGKIAGKASRILGGTVATGIGLAITPRALGNSTLGKNAPKTPPNALDASLSGAPSKAVGKGIMPTKAYFKKTKSTIVPTRQVSTKPSPVVTGQISQKNHMKMEPKVSSSSAPKPTKSTSVPRSSMQVTNPKGLLSRIGAALTKAPTPRGPSEYEQIMMDIQPSRKKKR